jgi:hypothetical protein
LAAALLENRTRTIDALGANRQRLTTLSKATPGTRLLPDDLFNVPHNPWLWKLRDRGA